ncbi:DUF2502 domain-containing protein [Pantoea sp. LMR881]|uniref:DUF2502 domain-containing protein n=1 Tax=Pantoea sp. LMR881 TaxID=3014336 RepID=UPI0022AF1AE5|nr:DUF2502 domain-containing protein [Pantoea sp. LMR881]MCZ4058575.1 DUF2502 domain-containing protein [Pantoea sp. LMR881]
MKKTAILLSILLGMPLLVNASVSVNINTPGVSIHIGDRDNRGYYWDGYDWRAPTWWKQHQGRHVGLKGPHGYWNGNGWQSQRPGNHKSAQAAQKHDSKPQHSQPQQKHDNKGHGNGNDQQMPLHK